MEEKTDRAEKMVRDKVRSLMRRTPQHQGGRTNPNPNKDVDSNSIEIHKNMVKTIQAYSITSKKRFQVKVVHKREFLKYENVDYYNKDEYDDRIPLLEEHLNREGQVIPIVVNKSVANGSYRVLSDWIIFNQMVKLGFQEIEVHLFQLNEEEERLLFEELNMIYGRFPYEVEEEIMERRLNAELEKTGLLPHYEDDLEDVDNSVLRADKQITFARYKTVPAIRKMHRIMLDKVKRLTGISSDEQAMTLILSKALKQLKEEN